MPKSNHVLTAHDKRRIAVATPCGERAVANYFNPERRKRMRPTMVDGIRRAIRRLGLDAAVAAVAAASGPTVAPASPPTSDAAGTAPGNAA